MIVQDGTWDPGRAFQVPLCKKERVLKVSPMAIRLMTTIAILVFTTCTAESSLTLSSWSLLLPCCSHEDQRRPLDFQRDGASGMLGKLTGSSIV